jgi:hypothetical protein
MKPMKISMRKLEIFQRHSHIRNSNVSSMEEAHRIFKSLPKKTQDAFLDSQIRRVVGVKK